MNLSDTINEEIKTAMKSSDADRLRALRNIKSAFLLLQTSGTGASEDEYLKALQKMAKQRKDSIEIFEKEGRNDLAEKEKSELTVIESYLPAQMGEAEVSAVIQEIINSNGFAGAKDMGKAMPMAMKALSGKADGKLISELVKKLLS